MDWVSVHIFHKGGIDVDADDVTGLMYTGLGLGALGLGMGVMMNMMGGIGKKYCNKCKNYVPLDHVCKKGKISNSKKKVY